MARKYDLLIVGMGSGGLVAARFAAKLDLRVGAIERHRIGGDCLWTGCVPSKALLASAKVAHHMRSADRFGMRAVEPEVDGRGVWDRIKAIQGEIAAAEDSAEHLEALGVEVIQGSARMTGPHTVAVDGVELEARYILLATGSRPAVPDLPGIEAAGFLTSETIFELDEPPESAVIIGGGPIAVEMAQALQRLGKDVTVLQRQGRILTRDEPGLVAKLTHVLTQEGVSLGLNVETERVSFEGGSKTVHGTEAGVARSWTAEELIVAAGRRPNVEDLGLDGVGVANGRRGIDVDRRMRTTVRSIYAAGDVAGRFAFTHSAGYEGAQAIRDMFFPGSCKLTELVPWCTFTDPELAHAGLTSAEAIELHGADKVKTHVAELADSDRARADGATEGAISIVTAKGRIVGAHVLSPAAGETIHELALAVDEKIKLNDLASLIHVYPTISTSINLLAADVAYEGAKRLSWLVRRVKGS